LESTLSLSLSLSAEASVGESVMAVAVVRGALLLIAQDGISLAALLEAFLGFIVAGVAVRMKLQRQLAVCTLDLVICRIAGDTEYFVIIAFYVSGQFSQRPHSGRPP